jgi:hypothetical protein
MRRFVLTLAAAAVLAGCAQDQTRAAGAAPATLGSFQSGGTFTPFYAEEVVNGRLYVFGKQSTYHQFKATGDVNPTAIRTFIGKGPELEVDGKKKHVTLAVETIKDEPAMEARLLATVKERYQLAW